MTEKPPQLPEIYEKIRKTMENPIVKMQMDAVAEWHKFMVKHYEDDVKIK